MLTLKKNPNKDFIILNLSDTQLSNDEWADGHKNRQILEYTITQLVQRAKPDLITISGDLAWASNYHAYKMLAQFLEGFQIPWAFVFGNHDLQNGYEAADKVVTEYLTYPHCVFEKGDPALGLGNYVIGIEEEGKIVQALIMLDSHDHAPFIDKNGEQKDAWAKLEPNQIAWYKEQVKMLKDKGCVKSLMFMHIPNFAYSLAAKAAYKPSVVQADLTITQADGVDCWNEGYEASIGVQHENISCYPAEDGVFAAIKETGLTQYILVGHDHVNNFIINYEGVNFVFALKTGAGCYWDPILNGGTVLKVGKDGIYDVKHDYVDISAFIKE